MMNRARSVFLAIIASVAAVSVVISLIPDAKYSASALENGQSTDNVSGTQQPIQVQTQNPSAQLMQMSGFSLPLWIMVLGAIIFIFASLPRAGWILGLIVVGDREVGIVVKKFSTQNLTAGHLIALNGEAGLQADVLPPGWHFGFFPWQYSVQKAPVVAIPQDEIGLVVACDGAAMPPGRILGQVVECNNFQNAREFLTNGGDKGRQLGILTTGTYQINTELFEVITSAEAAKHGMKPEQFKIYSVAPERVGIVSTLDGASIDEGEIAGPVIAGHDNFQKAQEFIKGGGRRGLQEQVLLSGSWNLNPWFVRVEQVSMTEVPIGYVGVVISFVG